MKQTKQSGLLLTCRFKNTRDAMKTKNGSFLMSNEITKKSTTNHEELTVSSDKLAKLANKRD